MMTECEMTLLLPPKQESNALFTKLLVPPAAAASVDLPFLVGGKGPVPPLASSSRIPVPAIYEASNIFPRARDRRWTATSAAITATKMSTEPENVHRYVRCVFRDGQGSRCA